MTTAQAARQAPTATDVLCDMVALRSAAELVSNGQAVRGFADFLRDTIVDENGRCFIEVLDILQQLRAVGNLEEHKRILANVDPAILEMDTSFLPYDLSLAPHELKVRRFYLQNGYDDVYSILYFNRLPGRIENYSTSNRYTGCGMFAPTGAMSQADRERLASVAKTAIRPGMKILEIGSSTGWGSTPILSNIAKSQGGEMWCIDMFRDCENMRKIFDATLKFYGLYDFVKVIEGASVEASKKFNGEYFDLIFVDGDHTYNGGKADLEHWEAKVRKGGTFCGHDCPGYVTDFLIDQLEYDKNAPDHRPISWFRNGRVEQFYAYAGIIMALYERYGTDFELDPAYKTHPVRSVWYKIM